MRINKKRTIIATAVLLLITQVAKTPERVYKGAYYSTVSSIGGPEAESEADKVKKRIQEYEAKIKNLQSQEKSLAKEIDTFDAQINLTELRIQSAAADIETKAGQIKKLELDIDDLGTRIDKLANSMDLQKDILGARSRARYESLEKSPLYLIFGADSVGDFLRKSEYYRAMTVQDQKLLIQMEKTKTTYANQQDLLEDKKSQIESLKKQIEGEKRNLENYSSQLASQKVEKAKLLEATERDENKYKALLAQAKAELDAIQGIVAGANFKNGEKVKKGDVIAYMGNSGWPICSSGAHLHFEIRKNGSLVNAESYLKSKSVYVNHYTSGYASIGSGKWDWPMDSPEITQRYGKTPWSWRYPSGLHTGIDMVAGNTAIRAPEDGIFIRGVQKCYTVSLNYAAIEHDDGVISYYLHIK